jgi:FecR protein
MSTSDEQLALLVDRYLDGELTLDERKRLAADPELVGRFIGELRFQGRVGGLLQQDGRALLDHVEDALALGSSTGLADRVVARLYPRRKRQWWLWVAGSVLAASIAAFVLIDMGKPSGVTAAVADGVNAPSQQVNLKLGALLSLNVNQEAQVAFKDGTRMDLSATSAVRVSGIDQGGARIALENGSLSAEVTKQPKGSHFQVATNDAVLTVIGTKFTATRFPWGTRVEVTEGRVRTRRSSDGSEVEIGVGNRVDVGSNAGDLSLQPIRPPLPSGAIALEPVADAIVVGGQYANENRGKRPSHVVTSQQTKADELRDFYLRFDLREVKAAPQHAELRLHLSLLKKLGMRLRVAKVDQPWHETTITWNNRPPRGADVATWAPDRDDAAIDLTTAVRQAMGGTLDLCLYADPTEPVDAMVGFHTREAPALLRPRLVIAP